MQPATQSQRPLITFLLLSFRQEKYVRAAVEAALSQTYSPLQIILSDDCSPDRTFEIMKEVASAYKGPHQVILNRNEKNLRLTGHFNHVCKLAEGEIIVLAAGDDIAFPERTEISWKILYEHPQASCVSFESKLIDAEGKQIEKRPKKDRSLKEYTLEYYLNTPAIHINGATRAFRRSAFTTFGPLSPTCPTEDSTTFLRCLILGSAYAAPEPAIFYRVHGASLSAPENLKLMSLARIFRQYLTDARVGFKKGLITEAVYSALRKQIRKNIHRRMLLSGLQQAPSKLGYVFSRLLWADVFTVKERWKFISRALRGK